MGSLSVDQLRAHRVNPRCGFNSYWPMPFRKKCRITMENLADERMTLYYQVNYALGEVPANAAYFHAQFRRENPLKTKGSYTILDGVEGDGQYVGTYLAYGTHHTGWWGEGEVKFFIDGDDQFPTICGTGTEDYFCGSYDFEGGATASRLPLNSPMLTPACRKSFARTDSTIRNNVSASTAGIFPIRSASITTSRSRSRIWAGNPAGATCRCRMTSPPWLFGIKPSRTRNFPPSPAATNWNCNNENILLLDIVGAGGFRRHGARPTQPRRSIERIGKAQEFPERTRLLVRSGLAQRQRRFPPDRARRHADAGRFDRPRPDRSHLVHHRRTASPFIRGC